MPFADGVAAFGACGEALFDVAWKGPVVQDRGAPPVVCRRAEPGAYVKATTIPRAERLALPIAIAYRLPDDDVWFQSRVINISETGVLFGPTALEAGAAVEVMFAAPVPIGTMAAGQLVCAGAVVRTTETGSAATRFDTCRFVLEP
jgi:hypothetical protein